MKKFVYVVLALLGVCLVFWGISGIAHDASIDWSWVLLIIASAIILCLIYKYRSEIMGFFKSSPSSKPFDWDKFWSRFWGFSKVILVLSIALYVLTWAYYRYNTEDNYGFGGLIEKPREMVAKTYSVDPFPGYQTLLPGHKYNLIGGVKYKYQGATWSWRLTPGQADIDMIYGGLGTGYGTIMAPRDCVIETSDVPFKKEE